MGEQLKMLHVFLMLLVGSTLSLPARQRNTSFKNFPVVGLKQEPAEESPEVMVESIAEVENSARAARQVEADSYTDTLDDVFVEEAVYLTPEDRERDQRALEVEEIEAANLDLDNFDFADESLVDDEIDRPERDGAHGSHGSHGPRRHSARNSRRFQQPQQAPVEQEFRQPQEQRGGRQTGQIGAATGVLSNPPSAKGDYNFNFSNNDGSSRQESGALNEISGSYSFITPEGENVNVSYVADETGFHATGSHIHMPAHVQRMLDHLAKVNGL